MYFVKKSCSTCTEDISKLQEELTTYKEEASATRRQLESEQHNLQELQEKQLASDGAMQSLKSELAAAREAADASNKQREAKDTDEVVSPFRAIPPI